MRDERSGVSVSPPAFSDDERRRLLLLPGIGPVVIGRLQAVGITSLQDLRRVGSDAVVRRICGLTNSRAWQNRRRALQSAIEAA